MLCQLVLGDLQLLMGLAEPSLRLGDALRKVCFHLMRHRLLGLRLVQTGIVECLKLVEAGTHGLEELLLLGASTSARLLDDLKPSGSEHFIVKHLPLGRCPSACRPWEVNEHVVTHL